MGQSPPDRDRGVSRCLNGIRDAFSGRRSSDCSALGSLERSYALDGGVNVAAVYSIYPELTRCSCPARQPTCAATPPQTLCARHPAPDAPPTGPALPGLLFAVTRHAGRSAHRDPGVGRGCPGQERPVGFRPGQGVRWLGRLQSFQQQADLLQVGGRVTVVHGCSVTCRAARRCRICRTPFPVAGLGERSAGRLRLRRGFLNGPASCGPVAGATLGAWLPTTRQPP